MSASVYTERLIETDAVTGTTEWPVPTGKRAVVTDVQAACTSAGVAGWVGVNDHPVAVIVADTLAKQWQWHGKMVAYAGERITIATGQPVSAMVVGYLFVDPVGGPPAG
ncbi:MAG TPA: hypothetical protein VF821_26320 [Lentzea sp.]